MLSNNANTAAKSCLLGMSCPLCFKSYALIHLTSLQLRTRVPVVTFRLVFTFGLPYHAYNPYICCLINPGPRLCFSIVALLQYVVSIATVTCFCLQIAYPSYESCTSANTSSVLYQWYTHPQDTRHIVTRRRMFSLKSMSVCACRATSESDAIS